MPKPHKTSRAKAGKADRPKAGTTVKSTIVLDRKLDFLLSSVASYRDINRSTLAADLIERGLKQHHEKVYAALCNLNPEKARKGKSAEEEDRSQPAGN
jgi:hypothetical protein